MPQSQQHTFSRGLRALQPSAFAASANQVRSLSQESALLPPSRGPSDKSLSSGTRGRRQKSDFYTTPTSRLRARSSNACSLTHRTPTQSNGSAPPGGTTAAAAAASASPPIGAAQTYNAKSSAKPLSEGAGEGGDYGTLDARSEVDEETRSTEKAAGGSPLEPAPHGKTSELPAVRCSDAADTAPRRGTANSKKSAAPSTTVVPRRGPSPRSTSATALPKSASQSSLSKVRGRGNVEVSDACESPSSWSPHVPTVHIAAPLSVSAASSTSASLAGNGGPQGKNNTVFLHSCTSDLGAKSPTTTPPPARLHPLPGGTYTVTSPVDQPLSLSLGCSKEASVSLSSGGLRSKHGSCNALAPLRPTPPLLSSDTAAAAKTGSGGSRSAAVVTVREAKAAGPAKKEFAEPAARVPLFSAASTSSIISTRSQQRLQPRPPAQQTGDSKSPPPTSRQQPVTSVSTLSKAASSSTLGARDEAAEASNSPVSFSSLGEPLVVVQLHATPLPLRNFGATCYLNSVVQCLLCTPRLLRSLNDDRQRIVRAWEEERRSSTSRAAGDAQRRSCAERVAPATSSLVDLGTAQPTHNIPVSQLLLGLKAACAEFNDEFSSNGQNDAHEFLITLLGVIDKEVCRSKPGSYETFKDVENEKKSDAFARWVARLQQENNSTVYDFFGGIAGSTVKCDTCGLISYRFEALLDISLPMTYRANVNGGRTAIEVSDGKNGAKIRSEGVVVVDELLREMFFSDRGEFLSGPMQVTCDRCKKLRDKTIWTTMEQWPPILVLHLKRFNNAGVKNEASVIFPNTFHPSGHVKYQLYGVCCHRGTSSFGHYTSYTYVEKEEDGAATGRRKPATAAATSGAVGGGGADGGVSCTPQSSGVSQSSTTEAGKGANGNADGTVSTPDRGAATSTEPQQGLRVGGFGRGDDASREGGAEGNRGGTGAQNGNTAVSGKVEGGRDRGGPTRSGKWYLCNDDIITEVSALDVLAMTKEAYILFYRRIDDAGGVSTAA